MNKYTCVCLLKNQQFLRDGRRWEDLLHFTVLLVSKERIIDDGRSSKQRTPLRHTFPRMPNSLLYNYTRFRSICALDGGITTCLLLLRFILLQYHRSSIWNSWTWPGTVPLFLVQRLKQVIWINGLCEVLLRARLRFRIEQTGTSTLHLGVVLFWCTWHWGTGNWYIVALTKISKLAGKTAPSMLFE